MKKLIQDLFMTKQADGTYNYDITNPAFSAVPVLISVLTYTVMGVYGGFTQMHVPGFELGGYLRSFAEGFGALSALGAGGVWAHSMARN